MSAAEAMIARMRATGTEVVPTSRVTKMSAGALREGTGFKTAKQLSDEERGIAPTGFRYPADTDTAATGTLVVRAEVGIEDAKRIWNAFLELRDLILGDPSCYDEIDGHKEINRQGATRLALPFSLSIEDRGLEEGRVEIADSDGWDYRYRAHVRVSKGSRFVDGIGSCRLSEISEKAGDLSRREHFAMTKAVTRAMKRGVSDMLGGTSLD